MASSADSFASNISLANFSKATELKQRIWFTIGALIVFRFLSFVPLPGINAGGSYDGSWANGLFFVFNGSGYTGFVTSIASYGVDVRLEDRA